MLEKPLLSSQFEHLLEMIPLLFPKADVTKWLMEKLRYR